MEVGDAPVVSVHGTADETVPFGTGFVQLLGLPVSQVDGSWPVHLQAESLGLDHAITLLEGEGHVPHMSDAGAYDLTRAAVTSSQAAGVPIVSRHPRLLRRGRAARRGMLGGHRGQRFSGGGGLAAPVVGIWMHRRVRRRRGWRRRGERGGRTCPARGVRNSLSLSAARPVAWVILVSC